MAVEPQIVGAVQAVAGLVALGFLKLALDNRDTPGSRSFGLFMIGTAIWMFGLSISNFSGSYRVSVLSYNILLLGVQLAAAAYLLLALTVTDRTHVARRVVGILVAAILGLQLLAWTNPLHHLFLGPGTHLDGVVFVPEYAVAFWIHAGYSYLCALVTGAILVVESVRSTGIRRKQTFLLALALVPIVVTTIITVFTDLTSPYDIAPFGYLLAAVFFVLVLFKGQFLDITTVARRTAMAEMNDAMVTLDDESRVIDANERARALFDSGDDYVGTAAADFFAPVSEDVLAQFATGTTSDTEITVDLDGQQRHFSLSISQIGEHVAEGRVVLLHDITAQKRREQELQVQNERLDQFASVVSHDLRNPLGIAETYLDFAENTGDRDDFQAVREAHERMDTMIDDLLTMARADTVIEDPEPIDMASLVTEAWETAQTDGATLETPIDDTTIKGDRDLLRNVFENLFRNAVDHNEPPVTVTVGLLDHGFYVADDGTGIPAGKREAVFNHGHTTSEDGTGFGLSIVSDLLTAHGWNVAVTDSDDGGARFEITGVEFA